MKTVSEIVRLGPVIPVLAFDSVEQGENVSRALHAGAFATLVALYFVTKLGPLAVIGVIATGVLLVYQHTLVRANDLRRLNAAFFTTNAFVSVILFVTFGGAVFIKR